MCADCSFFFFQAEDGIRDVAVTGVQTCALPIYCARELGETDPRSWLDGRGMLVAPLSRRSLQARRDRSQRKDSSPARIDNAANAVYFLGCSAHELFLGSPLSRPRKVELAGSCDF